MLRKYLFPLHDLRRSCTTVIALCILVLFVALFNIVLVVIPSSPVLAKSAIKLAPTATIDPTTILNEANAAATRAADASTKSDNAAITVNTVASDLNIVLVLLALFAAGLSAFGISEAVRLSQRVKQADNALKKIATESARIEDLVTKAKTDLVTVTAQVEGQAKEKMQEVVASLNPQIKVLRQEVTYLLRGYQLLEQKRKDQAAEAFKKVLEIRKEDAQANYALGRIYSGDKLYQEAITCLQKAIDTEPGFAEARMELGLVLRRQADKLYDDKTKGEMGPLNDETKQEALKQRADKYSEAINNLREAEKSLPGNEDILGALGGIYRRMKAYPTALVYYRNALQANPNSSYALGNVALLGYHEAEQQVARQAFENTISLATERIEAQSSRELWWDYYDRAMAKLVLQQIGDAAEQDEYKKFYEDYVKAIELTLNSESFESVLSGLKFLKEAEGKYTPPHIDGLNEIITKIEKAKSDMEAREKATLVGKEKAQQGEDANKMTNPDSAIQSERET